MAILVLTLHIKFCLHYFKDIKLLVHKFIEKFLIAAVRLIIKVSSCASWKANATEFLFFVNLVKEAASTIV